MTQQDIWSRWLLDRRFGGDPQQMKVVMNFLNPIRDNVLSHVNLHSGDVMLDVGCGDGLLAFGALDSTAVDRVIFSDISQDLLDHVQRLAQEMGVVNRCEFLRASADDLSAINSASVDAVTTRSVLIYVAGKQSAFTEFYRVLKPTGHLSIFEPINSFAFPEPDPLFDGYDVTPVLDLARKIKALYLQLQPPGSDPMLDFDERDLIRYAEHAGFQEIHLDYQVTIKPNIDDVTWDMTLRVPGNPKIPNLEEAMQQTLTSEETQRFVEHLRPLVEAKRGVARSAVAYLWAVK
jgi:arsenite methyltransferase